MRGNDAPGVASGIVDDVRPGADARIHADAQDDADVGVAKEFVSFAVGADQYGVDIMSVREIREWSKVTRLPKQPDYVRGVLNLRGVMVPIVDLRCRFGQGLTEATPQHIVIVVQIDERVIGLLVDRVLDILALASNAILPVPKVTQSSRIEFLSGLFTTNDELVALIDLPGLLPAG
jgi:purine-binding chemotaxis protein CheW